MLTKNQIIELTVDTVSNQGSGVARHEGMAVFIPRTAPGDRLLAKVVKPHKSYAFAIVEELLEPSSHRVENLCPVYRRCGGCSLRHLDYSKEVEIKEGWLRENLMRIGGTSLVMDPAIPAPASCRYRNKALYPVRLVEGKVKLGFFAARSHTLIPVEDCLLQPAHFAEISGVVTRFLEEKGVSIYNEEKHTGLVRHLYLRYGEATGQTMVCLVVNGDGLPHWQELLEELLRTCPGISTLVLLHNKKRTNVITAGEVTPLYGDGTIEDVLCGVKVRLSPQSFYQVNRAAAELLYQAALDYADPSPGDLLLDLYCGAGTIGLSMAHRVGQVVGVEVVPQAVEDARRAAAENGIIHARFLCDDAAGAAAQLEAEGLTPNIVVLDPPRKGADGELLQTIVRLSPKKLVYVSCDSATLARDIKELRELGYRLERCRAVDLFPRTAHVESVALLLRE